jgi:hypothetical protein
MATVTRPTYQWPNVAHEQPRLQVCPILLIEIEMSHVKKYIQTLVLDNLRESSIIPIVVVFGTIMPVLDLHVIDNPSLFKLLLSLIFILHLTIHFIQIYFKTIIYFIIIWFIIKGIWHMTYNFVY